MQECEIVWEADLQGIPPEQVARDYVQQTSLGRLDEPEYIAEVVVFLSSAASGFMTGQSANVTGGVYMT
jgi:NAD(P)-dependent dehydrogenase (short-subunit alcohol dehydrogenase family)